MKRFAFGTLACCLFALSSCASNEDKILGTWKIVKIEGKDAPKDEEVTIEFGKEAKLTRKITIKEKEFKEVGSYLVTGDQVKMTFPEKQPGGTPESSNGTIKTLSGETLIIAVDNKDTEYKKK